METYLVGGAVRDALLGLPVGERDWVVVGATESELERLGYRRADPAFPVYLHPETGEEHALARRERKRGTGYKGFDVETGPGVRLAEDLARRDLRVNAIARGADGTLVDPFDGCADIDARRLRHVTPAFVEDPLRLLRAARFAATLGQLGFAIDDETLALMREMAASGELRTLSGTRRWRETARALESACPARFVEALAACGALAELLPDAPDDARVAAAVDALDRGVTEPGPAGPRAAALACLLDARAPGAVAEALGAPGTVVETCALAAGWDAPRLAALDADADRLMGVVESLDALRRPERLERFAQTLALTCAGDAGARAALDALRVSRGAAASVSARDLAGTGLSGRALGEALRQARRDRAASALARTSA